MPSVTITVSAHIRHNYHRTLLRLSVSNQLRACTYYQPQLCAVVDSLQNMGNKQLLQVCPIKTHLYTL